MDGVDVGGAPFGTVGKTGGLVGDDRKKTEVPPFFAGVPCTLVRSMPVILNGEFGSTLPDEFSHWKSMGDS